MKTPLYSIGRNDILKGALMAAGAVIATSVYNFCDAGVFPTTAAELKPIGLNAIGAFCLYLVKNFLTNSKDQFVKKES